MDPVFKKKWIAALRSKKYKQTKGVLKNNAGYCCLGVACDIVDDSKWGHRSEIIAGCEYDNASYYCLPRHIQEKYNVSEELANELMAMNDNGSSFAEIADYIETHG